MMRLSGCAAAFLNKPWGIGLAITLAMFLGISDAKAQTSPTKSTPKAETAPKSDDDWGFTFPRFFSNLDDIPKLPDNRIGMMGLITNEHRSSRHGPAYEGNVFGLHGALRPDIDYTYENRLFINSDDGIGGYFYNDNKFYTGAALYAREGRGNGPHGSFSGLGRIDSAAQLRAFVGYDFGFIDVRATATRDLGGTDGSTIQLKASNVLPLSPKLFLLPEVGMTIGNGTYMQALYGVSATQSLNSGLPVYNAKSGVESVDMAASLIYVIDKKWAPFIRAEGRYLYGSADKTPIYYRRMVTGVGIGVSYLFD